MLSRHILGAALLLLSIPACTAVPDPGGSLDEGPTDSPPSSGASPTAPGATPSAPTSSSATDLGTAASGTPITFDVPAGTLGFTIIVDANVTADDFLGVEELRDPSGALVVDAFTDARVPGRFLTGDSGTGLGVVRVPLVDDHAAEPLPAGRWTVKLGGTTRDPKAAKGTTTPWSGPIHGALQLQTTHDGAFHGGAIDLDLYVPAGLLVDGHAMTTTSAPADLAGRLDIVFGLFQRLYGVDRGDVRVHPIAASVTSITGQDEIDAANVLATATSARPSVQVVLTNHLSPDGKGSGEISGITNCLPGAPGVPGTRCSAIIVSLREDSPDWQDAATLVHELGHFVGLGHTTEFGGDTDTLADTPVCPASSDKNALASCPDHDNLMFPSVNLATDEASIAVSATQRSLFRSSAVYRATP